MHGLWLSHKETFLKRENFEPQNSDIGGYIIGNAIEIWVGGGFREISQRPSVNEWALEYHSPTFSPDLLYYVDMTLELTINCCKQINVEREASIRKIQTTKQ